VVFYFFFLNSVAFFVRKIFFFLIYSYIHIVIQGMRGGECLQPVLNIKVRYSREDSQ